MPLTSTALLSIFRVVAADIPCAYEGHCRYGTSCWFCDNQQLTPDVYQTSPLPYQNLYASYPVPEAAYGHAPLDRDGNLSSTKYQHNPYVNIATASLTHELETTTESQPGAEAYPLADITPNAPVIPDVPFRVRVHRFPQPECSEAPAHGNCGNHDSSTTDTTDTQRISSTRPKTTVNRNVPGTSRQSTMTALNHNALPAPHQVALN